jgi:ATP-dependent Lon protease
MEMEKIKNLRYENIDITKKIAMNPDIPDNVKTVIMDRFQEAESNPENSHKAMLAVDLLLKYPWKPTDSDKEFLEIGETQKKSHSFMTNFSKKLDQSIYGHEESKSMLVEQMGTWIINPTGKGRVIGLYGPPGCGKTILARSVSEALGLPFNVIKLGGMNDVGDLVGHNYTYSTAEYGMMVRKMVDGGNHRCVILFDEVDKISRKNGVDEITPQLIHITDPEMNTRFNDRFFSSTVDFDLSNIIMIFTYNVPSNVDQVLLDRFAKIEVKPYTIKQKIEISNQFMLRELCNNVKIDDHKVVIPEELIHYIIDNYTIEAGVRDLKRKLDTILRKLNLDRIYLTGPFSIQANKLLKEKNKKTKSIYAGENNKKISKFYKTDTDYNNKLTKKQIRYVYKLQFDEPIVVNKKMVQEYLGKPNLHYTKINDVDIVGYISALYATSLGTGGIIPIQLAESYTGTSGSFVLDSTGSQGNDMKQSHLCSYNAIMRLIAPKYREDIKKKYSNGIHIHAPAISDPKDGPSAGCAFAVAFASFIMGKKINRFISMTGEVDLYGNMTAIGGLCYKLYGAKRAGIRVVYISKENEKDYNEIKKEHSHLFDDNFKIIIVEHIYQLLTDPNIIIGIKKTDFDKNSYQDFISSKKKKQS